MKASIAGLKGATGVAAWSFVIDLLLGRPFATPDAFGRVLFGLLGQAPLGSADIPVGVGYTIFHYLALVAAGLLVSAIV